MKWPSEMLQNFPFFLSCNFIFSFWIFVVLNKIDTDHEIYLGKIKIKVAWTEKYYIYIYTFSLSLKNISWNCQP